MQRGISFPRCISNERILERRNIMSTILLIVLVLLLLGALPVWPYSRSWGYGGSGILGFLLLLVLLGLLFRWF
jgi:hypothetical protein